MKTKNGYGETLRNALVLEGTQWAGFLAAPKPPKETNPENPS